MKKEKTHTKRTWNSGFSYRETTTLWKQHVYYIHGSERQGYCIQLNEETELFHTVNEEVGFANPHRNYPCR